MWLYSPESTQKAAGLFEQALGLDPDFAMATPTWRTPTGALGARAFSIRPRRFRGPRKSAARRRRRCRHGRTHTGARGHPSRPVAVGRRRTRVSPGPRSERSQASRARARAPLSLRGSADAAVEEVTRARELDPIGLSSAIDAAAVFYNLRRYDRALETLRAALNLDSTSAALWTWIGIVNGGKGQFGDALVALDRAKSMGDQTAATQCYYVHALAKVGRQDEALRQLDAMLKSHTFVPPSSLAIAYVGVGRYDRAMEALEAGYAARDPLLQYVGVESHLDSLQRDLRFRDLMARIGLPL